MTRVFRKRFRDIEVPVLSFCGFRWPMDEHASKQIDMAKGHELVDKCFECGINYFDTAYTYQQGDSERFLGESLTRCSGDSYYLATKFYVVINSNVQEIFEEQLRRLKTDHFDFYLLHCMDENNMSAYMDPKKWLP
ncbi:MAG: aldo/keto reductase [Christensenellales bacterium]